MSNLDLIKMSLGNLWRRKLRTLLTVLGVIIGTASIITTLSLGFGMKEQNKKLLAQMGPVDVIKVVSYPIYDPETQKQKDAKPLDDKALEEIAKIENVQVTIPTLEVDGVDIASKKYSNFAQIIGVDPEKYALLNPEMQWGRFLEASDGEVAVFGGGLKRSWYDQKSRGGRMNDMNDPDKTLVDLEKDPITMNIGEGYDPETEQRKYSKTHKIKVVGELPEEDWETAYNVYIPMDFALKLKREIKRENDKQKADGMVGGMGYRDRNSTSKYSSIIVKVDDIKNMRAVNDKVKALGYNAQSNLQATDALNKNVESTQKILGGIGAVSLLVAAIGIANTMVMSIYERIKEIGIMKVIGANVSDIKKMFLTEAAFIGLFGGALGIGVSYIASAIINYVSKKGNPDDMGGMIGGLPMMGEGKISIIPIWLILVALLFATIVGILSGYYPARKATKLSPLEAIRTQ